MKFKSIEECVAYIENAHNEAKWDVAQEERKILQKEVLNQLYNKYTPKNNYDWRRTYRTFDNIWSEVNGDIVSLYLKDDQSWYSVYDSSDTVYAFEMVERGFTWGRPKTHIKKSTMKKVNKEGPKKYKKSMKSKGIPIR